MLVVWDVPKTTLRPDAWLKGLTVIVVVAVYYRGGIRITNQHSEKGQGAKPGRNQLQASRCPSWWTGLGCTWFCQWWCATACVKCYQPGKLPEPWCAGMSWGLSYGSMQCLGDWATLIPALTPTLSKTSIHLNHIVRINLPGPTGIAGPKASGVQKHSYQADYSTGSEMNSQYFFWAIQASTEFFYPLIIGKLCK